MLHTENLLLSQVTFKYAELNALTEIFQDLVDTIPPLIIVDVIGNDQVHVYPFFEKSIPMPGISVDKLLKSHNVTWSLKVGMRRVPPEGIFRAVWPAAQNNVETLYGTQRLDA